MRCRRRLAMPCSTGCWRERHWARGRCGYSTIGSSQFPEQPVSRLANIAFGSSGRAPDNPIILASSGSDSQRSLPSRDGQSSLAQRAWYALPRRTTATSPQRRKHRPTGVDPQPHPLGSTRWNTDVHHIRSDHGQSLPHAFGKRVRFTPALPLLAQTGTGSETGANPGHPRRQRHLSPASGTGFT